MLVSIVGQAELIEEQWVVVGVVQAILQIFNGWLEILDLQSLGLIEKALGSVHEEFNVLAVFCNGLIIVILRLFILVHRMIAAAEAVLNARIPVFLFDLIIINQLLLFFLCNREVIDGLLIPAGVVLAEASSEVAFREILVQLNRLIEILYGLNVVAHILVNRSSSYIDDLVILHFHNDFAEAVEGLVGLLCFMVD